MIRQIDMRTRAQKIWGVARIFILGAIFGTVITASMLDNRLNAMIKAFQHPQAVNEAMFDTSVVVKAK